MPLEVVVGSAVARGLRITLPRCHLCGTSEGVQVARQALLPAHAIEVNMELGTEIGFEPSASTGSDQKGVLCVGVKASGGLQ